MRGMPIFVFIFSMWLLILVGGEITVLILPAIEVEGYGELDNVISSGIKGAIAVALVVIWIVILTKVKNWIFRKQLKL